MNLHKLMLSAALLATLAQSVCACSPGVNIDIYFSKNNAELTVANIRKLADFSIYIKQNFPNHESFEIIGLATQDEEHPSKLARRRAMVLEQYFTRTQYQQAPIKVGSRIILNDQRYLIKNPNRAELRLTPKAPHGCSASALTQSL